MIEMDVDDDAKAAAAEVRRNPLCSALERLRFFLSEALSTEDKEKLWIAIVLCKGEVLNNLSETCTHIIIPSKASDIEMPVAITLHNMVKKPAVVTAAWVWACYKERAKVKVTYHMRKDPPLLESNTELVHQLEQRPTRRRSPTASQGSATSDRSSPKSRGAQPTANGKRRASAAQPADDGASRAPAPASPLSQAIHKPPAARSSLSLKLMPSLDEWDKKADDDDIFAEFDEDEDDAGGGISPLPELDAAAAPATKRGKKEAKTPVTKSRKKEAKESVTPATPATADAAAAPPRPRRRSSSSSKSRKGEPGTAAAGAPASRLQGSKKGRASSKAAPAPEALLARGLSPSLKQHKGAAANAEDAALRATGAAAQPWMPMHSGLFQGIVLRLGALPRLGSAAGEMFAFEMTKSTWAASLEAIGCQIERRSDGSRDATHYLSLYLDEGVQAAEKQGLIPVSPLWICAAVRKRAQPDLDELEGYKPLVCDTARSHVVALTGFRNGVSFPSHSYLKQLVRALGWTYTGTLSKKNTLLIACKEAHRTEKVAFAEKHAIELRRFSWLEAIVRELRTHARRVEKPMAQRRPLVIAFTKVDIELRPTLTEIATFFGGSVDPAGHCSHLICDEYDITAKLLRAMFSCDHIVTSQWLLKSREAGHLLPEENFHLDAHKAGARPCDLTAALQRQRMLRPNRLLTDWSIYALPDALRDENAADIASVVEASGARLVLLLNDRHFHLELGKMREMETKGKLAVITSLGDADDDCARANARLLRQHSFTFVLSVDDLIAMAVHQTTERAIFEAE